MPPSVTTFNGRDAALIGRTVLSIRASRSHQDRENLIQLLSISLLTYSPPLVEAVYSRLSSMSWLRAAKRADIKTLILPDGSAPSTDNIEDLLSIAQYSDPYFLTHGDNITKKLWSEMKTEHYELFYLTGSFAVPI